MMHLRKLSEAITFAVLLSGGLLLTAANVEAAGGNKKSGTTCEYLASVINYPYVAPAIKLWALSLYKSMGCQP